MTEDELKTYIEAGRESRHLEYKRSESWDDSNFKATITKSVLGMSNIKDGGTIVIGMDKQEDGSYIPQGVQPNYLEAFNNEDSIKTHIANFADPCVDFDVEIGKYQNKDFVVIIVREFEELPVICKADGPKNLRKGAVYTRTRRHPETAEVPSQTEMREIVELAVDKGMRKLSERGYVLRGQKSSEKLFSEELNDFDL